MIWYSCPFFILFPCFFVSYVFQFPGLENTTLKRCWKTPLLEFGTSSDHTLNISLLEEPTKDSLHFELRLVNYFFHFSQIFVSKIRYLQNLQYINDKCWVLIWVFPLMVVPPKHPKMSIFSRKTHGCWVPHFRKHPYASFKTWHCNEPHAMRHAPRVRFLPPWGEVFGVRWKFTLFEADSQGKVYHNMSQ